VPSENIQERIARNEAIFREANEGIERGLWPDQRHDDTLFRCECARLGCSEPVAVNVADYERVRRDPRRFIVRIGHEVPDVETIVERNEKWLVVEKQGRSGELAAELDPRS
jgi:hypothetical protein